MGKARINGTLEYFKTNTWNNMKKRCINTGKMSIKNKSYLEKGILLKMTKDEFYNFCDENKNIIMDFYKNKITPSIDRIDHFGHYELSNIRVISFIENRKESSTRSLKKRVDSATEAKKKKIKLILPDDTEENFNSIKEACLKYNLLSSKISQVLKGTRKTHKNFKAVYIN